MFCRLIDHATLFSFLFLYFCNALNDTLQMNWESIQVHVDFVTAVQKEDKQKVSNSAAQSQVDFPWGQFHTKASFFFCFFITLHSPNPWVGHFDCRDLKKPARSVSGNSAGWMVVWFSG